MYTSKRIVSGAGVRARHEEQVWIAVRAGALVSLCAVGPFVAQRSSTQAGDREWRAGQMHVVTGGEHEAVQVMLDAVAGAKANRAQRRDRPGR